MSRQAKLQAHLELHARKGKNTLDILQRTHHCRQRQPCQTNDLSTCDENVYKNNTGTIATSKSSALSYGHNLHKSLLNICSIVTQTFVCQDVTRNSACSKIQTVQRKDAACSKQQNPAYCQSACPFSVGTTHAPTLQLYGVHTKDGATTVLDSVVR